jgi:hypothetical protein
VSQAGAVAAISAAVLLVNIPFGYWRAGYRKLSPGWFTAIHLPVPLVIAMRWAAGVPFAWINLPFFVTAYFAGQTVGARLRRRRGDASS